MYLQDVGGVILDLGSHSVRVGYAGSISPDFILPSVC
jgi:actin-related protein